MFWYIMFYVLGFIVALFSPVASVQEALVVIEPITLTALVASLLVPFAGFASNERWQKFVLQFAIVPLFGVYTVVLWRESSLVGIVLLVCASSVHAGYWMSGIHSRQYRLEQFCLEFSASMPQTTKLIAFLNGSGKSEQADAIVTEILRNHTMGEDDREALRAERARVMSQKAMDEHNLLAIIGKAMRG